MFCCRSKLVIDLHISSISQQRGVTMRGRKSMVGQCSQADPFDVTGDDDDNEDCVSSVLVFVFQQIVGEARSVRKKCVGIFICNM